MNNSDMFINLKIASTSIDGLLLSNYEDCFIV